jgi:5-methylcytosine-specific restriction endonuclease McrA
MPESTKRCTACGEERPLSAFSRSKTGRLGLCAECKMCASKRVARWAAANPEKVRRKHRRNPARARARMARWRKNNRDRALAASRRAYEQQREWRARNPERSREHGRRYALANPDMGRACVLRRRSRVAGVGGAGMTATQWREMRASYCGVCAYCGRRSRLTADHVVPISQGGPHDVGNIAPACRPCNSSKNDTPLIVWLAKRAA